MTIPHKHSGWQTGCLILLFVLAVNFTNQAMPPSRLYFDHYNDRNGLTSNSVNFILQDRQGFIWVATKDGLNRFDGFNFRHIDTGEKESCNFVLTIFEDKDGKIWIGAHNGAFIYDPSTEYLHKFTVPRENGDVITQPVIQILNDEEGNILLLVDSDGVYSFHKGDSKLTSLYHSDSIKVNEVIYDPNGKIWIGTFGQGLFYSEDNFKTLSRFAVENNERFNAAIISDLKMKGNQVYAATERCGVVAVDVNTNQVTSIFPDPDKDQTAYIRQILFDPKGMLYIASENGIYIYDSLKARMVSHLTHNIFDRYSISDNAIYAILCDREGGIWVGSYFGGLDYADTRRMKFDKYYPDNSSQSLRGQRVRELCEDPVTGMIYVGTEDRGLHCFNPSTGSFSTVEGVGESNVHGLCIDNRQLWIGTFSKGLKIKDVDSGKVKEYSLSHGLASDYIFAIKRTFNGDIVIGTMGGLQVYDRQNDWFETIPELANIFIYDILEDSKGNLWVATYDHGLYMRPAAHNDWICFRCDFSNPGSIVSNKVYGVYEDRENRIWVMTQDGLCIYDPETSSFGRDKLGVDRLQGVVYQVIDDDLGRLWFTTNHGL